MRAGEQLVAMTPDRLKAIFDESEPDFSAKICPGASLDHLSPEAIARFRTMWLEKSGNQALAELSDAQLLADAKLLVDRGVTYAALVLLGTPKALGRHLAQAELIFEYRSSEANIAHQQREAYREAFLLFHGALWQKINLRNDLFSYQNGLVRRKVPTF
ncbi:MAG: transcriptional regulator, partial [bacterium]|nr:transcriptional regulator [bacterium]